MSRPASPDLRQRVVAAYEAGEGSYRTLAAVFRVDFKSVNRWVVQARTTGSLAPKAHGGGRPRAIPDAERAVLRDLVLQQRDATLVELAARLAAATGLEVAPPRISEALTALGLPRKKSRRTRASSTATTSRRSARSSRSRNRRSRRTTSS